MTPPVITGQAPDGDESDQLVPDDSAPDLLDEEIPDQIRLTTAGIDIGSATTHFVLSSVTLRRLGAALMSRFEIVARSELYRSPILFTPYRSATEIDAEALEEFFTTQFDGSGVSYDELDTGIVMLTGEAARKVNARSIADLSARTMGKFVCSSAGHHLEARMAAHGSGAIAASRASGSRVINLDVGGGTSKFTLIDAGEIVGTAALNVGGRLVALEDGVVARIDDAANKAASAAGVELVLGETLSDQARELLCAALARSVVEYLTLDPARFSPLTRQLLLTEPLEGLPDVTEVIMSGGVSEYLDHSADIAEDLGPDLAAEILRRSSEAGRSVSPAPERMRATVLGLSQFSTQLSGDTVFVSSDNATPLINLAAVPVDLPDPGPEISPAEVSAAVWQGLVRAGRQDITDPAAIILRWHGRPYFRSLSAIAEGLALAAGRYLPDGVLVVVLSQDCARSLGRVLREVVPPSRDVVCIDGLEVSEHDFIDVGAPIQNGRVLPVVVKTLVFPEVRASVSGTGRNGDGQYIEVGGRLL